MENVCFFAFRTFSQNNYSEKYTAELKQCWIRSNTFSAKFLDLLLFSLDQNNNK